MTNQPQTPPATPAVVPAVTAVASDQTQAGAAPAPSSQDKTDMLNAEIGKAWNKLSPDDVKLQETQPDQFFAKLREKHNVTREDAQKRLKEIKAACGACTAEKAA
jgi:hypothetical protein